MKPVTKQPISEPASISLPTVAIKATALALAFVLASFTLLFSIAALLGYSYIKKVSVASDTSLSELRTLATSAYGVTPRKSNPVFLILGTDSLETRGDIPPLTDTMLLASLNVESGEVRLLPLPRDIWSEAYKTKINALLAYGMERYPSEPERFPEEVLEEMTGVPIDFSIIINMTTLADLVDFVSGVPVDIPTSFVDTQFPNPTVDITTETDPKKLYTTVSFSKGKELMTGERFLQFIRSRHSDSSEGNDLARSERQKIALGALMQALLNKSVLKDPTKVGMLFAFYEQNFATNLPLNDLVAIAKALQENAVSQVSVSAKSLTVQTATEPGVLFHPDAKKTQNIWLYQITDQRLLQKEVGEALGTR